MITPWDRWNRRASQDIEDRTFRAKSHSQEGPNRTLLPAQEADILAIANVLRDRGRTPRRLQQILKFAITLDDICPLSASSPTFAEPTDRTV